MSNPALILEQQLRELRDEYARQLPEKMKQIEITWRQLVLGHWTAETFKLLYRQVHGLAGSGATFGFQAVGDCARSLEDYLKPYLDSATAPSDAVLLQMNARLGALRKLCRPPSADLNDTQPVGKLHQFIPPRRG